MIHVSASQFIGLWGCLSRSFRECRRDASFKFWSWTWRSMLNISIAFWIHDWNQLQATTINTGRAEIYISWVDGASRGVPGSGRFVYGDPGKIFEPRYRETVELPPSRLIINHKLSKVLLRPGSLKIAWLYLCSTSILFIFYFEKVDWARLQQLEGVQLRLFYYKDIPILTESHTTLVPRLVPHSIILPPSWIVLIASGRFNSALDYQREASSQSVPILDSHQASLFPSVSVVRDCLELKECNQKI